MMKKKSFLLLFFSFLTLAPLLGQRVNENYPFLSYWDFKIKGVPDSVDCRYYPNNELYLSGFDTDGKGTFYFAGGNPLRVSCFKGTELQWRRKVSDVHTRRAQTCPVPSAWGQPLPCARPDARTYRLEQGRNGRCAPCETGNG